MKYFTIAKIPSAKNQFIFLGFSWVLVQCFLLWQNGIVTGLEAEKYITQANNFLQFGKPASNNFYFYSTQIFLIAAAIKLQVGFTVIVIIQLLLNLFATIMFYRLAICFLKSPLIAVMATFFFIVNIPYQVYNSFLFTESIFYSLTIIYSSLLLRLKNLTIKNILLLMLFLVLLSFTRPTGILFVAASALYIFFRFFNHLSVLNKTLIISCTVLLFLITVNTMLEAGGELDFMLPFKKENIICGVNTNNYAEIKTLEKGNSLQGIIYYIFNNEQQFLELAKLKTISFFGMIRSYYSPFHNAWLILFFYPFYILSIWGIWKKTKQKNKRIIYMITIIMLYWITTLLTCDDWHNRFILTVSPFLFLLGFAAFFRSDRPGLIGNNPSVQVRPGRSDLEPIS